MIVTCKSRVAALCLIGALASTAAAEESAADRSLGNAQLAVEALHGGMAQGSSVEGASAGGLKAEELLVSGKASGAGAGAVDARGGSQAKRLAQNLAARTPQSKEARLGVPLPPDGPEKPRGFLGGLRDRFNALMRPAADGFGSMGKAKRIAVLVGLLAVEAAAVIYPYQVVGIAMTALGALGLFGTARELIGMFRRRGA